MSEVRVNKISPRSGTTVTLGDSGDTITIPSGVTLANSGTFTNFQSTGIDDNATSTAITIDSSDNVGIGTSSPVYNLDVLGQTGSLTRLRIKNDGTAASDSSVLQLQIAGTTAESLIYFANPSDANVGQIRYDHASDYLSINVNASERMRIDSSGNVGIGTSSPENNLHIFTNSGGEGLTIKSTGNTSNAIIVDANRSSAGNAINQLLGRWNGTDVADIIFQTGSDTTNKDDGIITFRTSSANNISERMRIDSSGNLLINTTTSPSSHNNSLVIGENQNNPNSGGIFGHQIINKVFRTQTTDNTNFDITLTASSNLSGCFTVSVFGGYGNTNREGYAEYRVYCNRETNSIRTVTVQSPVNENGAFTGGYSFSATKPNNSSIKFAVNKGTGAHYWMIINGGLADNRFTGATRSES